MKFTLSNLFATLQSEGKYVIYAFIIYKFIKFYRDDKYGPMVISGIVGALCLYFLGAPESLTNALSFIGDLLVGK